MHDEYVLAEISHAFSSSLSLDVLLGDFGIAIARDAFRAAVPGSDLVEATVFPAAWRGTAAAAARARAAVGTACVPRLHDLPAPRCPIAAPVICECLECGGCLGLANRKATRGGPTMFYEPFELGTPGRLLVKVCHKCNIVYEVDGYMRLELLNATKAQRIEAGAVKLYYSAEHVHPRWIRLSDQTFVSTEFALLDRALLQTCHAGWSQVERASAYVAVKRYQLREGRPYAAADVAPRAMLEPKRLAEALLKNDVMHEVARCDVPHVAGNVNALLPINTQLAMLDGIRQARLTDAATFLHFLHGRSLLARQERGRAVRPPVRHAWQRRGGARPLRLLPADD